ncbi:hypothetical protein BD311DRAFT_459487 [Dichomitus squalens]|uniref:Uncharacterized protein n=1 Tax=Dichomitus squalens TaxID=114155 RepID=A0A4V2JZR9_9APHY|nr:hypothetical protein BD311DRAFT_459487 [Dichomitus squalens]
MSFPSIETRRKAMFSLPPRAVGTRSAAFEVDTPQPPPTQCRTTKLTWQGGVPPYVLQIVYEVNGTVAQEFDSLTNNTLFWTANITAGTRLHLVLSDTSSLAPSDSGPFIIQPGVDSCLSNSSGTNSSIGPSGTTSPPGSRLIPGTTVELRGPLM